MASLRPLVPLFVTIGFLLGGNGLQGSVIALRGAQEGFSPTTIGLFGAAYFAGFLLSCAFVPRLLRSVGHIRVFAALAALASVGTLLMVLVITPIVWVLMRFLAGLCFAGLFTTVESWLNSGASNQNRGRVLSIYRIIDISSVVAGQYLMAAIGTRGFDIFAVMAMLVTLSLVPVSLVDRSNPQPPAEVALDLRRVWQISPLAAFGCMAVGFANSAFRLVGPVYGEMIGFSVTEVATLMSAGIAAGAFVQYPLGHLSDRWGRRQVLMLASTVALFAGLAIALWAGRDPGANFLLILAFGAGAMPLYSLSVAHANDFAPKEDYVRLAAGLLFYYSLGAIVGPLGASALMQHFGPPMLFVATSAVYATYLAFIFVRMRARRPVPASRRKRFVPLLRTSPMFTRLVKRSGPPAPQ